MNPSSLKPKTRSIALTLLVLILPIFAMAGEKTPEEGLHLRVEGMKSDDCEMYLEDNLVTHLDTVLDVRADHETGWVWIEIEPTKENEQAVRGVVESVCSFTISEVRRDPPTSPTETSEDRERGRR